MDYLNVRAEIIKLLEENTGITLFDVVLAIYFLTMSLQAMEIKAKKAKNKAKWDYIKLKNICIVKETINKTKRQPAEWEKIFANDISDKGLNMQNIQRTHTTQHEKPNLNKKWAEDLNRHLSREDIQTANRHMKRCSTSLIIREMQIKTTMRYHFTPVGMVKKTTNNKS